MRLPECFAPLVQYGINFPKKSVLLLMGVSDVLFQFFFSFAETISIHMSADNEDINCIDHDYI